MIDSLGITLFITFFVFSLAVLGAFYLRGRQRRTNERVSNKAPVVVTSTTHTAPGSYPVTQVPPPNTYQQQPMYPHYPTATSGPNQMPMPMPMPMPSAQPPMPGMQPYPPAVPAANYNPPSYEAAVAGVGVAQPNTYEKQAPYNPNYNAY
ncbi:PREDICTED: protein shisa-5 isoform X5 [Bactrocera latifrons]|uniref:protein shisa-5 isoform X5 n=1 Tax=Bactrocera latifrons TaxID=174628 RepID=UPI0008DE236A|nr:PREDICTED: protein shisa-5 isoform X5 [Bactrocera latifrons]